VNGKDNNLMQHRTVIAAAICIAAAGVGPVLAAPASAAIDNTLPTTTTSPQYACGYDGYQDNGQPFYNHCGRTDIVIQVDHLFWQTIYDCVKPGVHRVDQGNSQWAIIGAEYDGHLCSTPGTVVGP
jgi:hypothetical protein